MHITGQTVVTTAHAVADAGRELPVRRVDEAMILARRAMPGSAMASAASDTGRTLTHRLLLLADACAAWSDDACSAEAAFAAADASLAMTGGPA